MDMGQGLGTNGWALLLYVVLGLAEFFVINRALRAWLGMKGWTVALLAMLVSYFPIVGGIAACFGAIVVLEWRWWIAAALFVGGTVALALTGGLPALWGNVGLF